MIDARESAAGEASTQPLMQVLKAIARELADMAQVGDRLQLLISAALVVDGGQNKDHVREFQAVDLLVQRLHGTAIFTECLSAMASRDWRIDSGPAALAVPLSDLARRLGADAASPSDRRHAHDPSGDLELFG